MSYWKSFGLAIFAVLLAEATISPASADTVQSVAGYFGGGLGSVSAFDTRPPTNSEVSFWNGGEEYTITQAVDLALDFSTSSPIQINLSTDSTNMETYILFNVTVTNDSAQNWSTFLVDVGNIENGIYMSQGEGNNIKYVASTWPSPPIWYASLGQCNCWPSGFTWWEGGRFGERVLGDGLEPFQSVSLSFVLGVPPSSTNPTFAVDFAPNSFSIDSTSGTPEPSTWSMMLMGFAGLGFAGYRRARASHATLAR